MRWVLVAILALGHSTGNAERDLYYQIEPSYEACLRDALDLSGRAIGRMAPEIACDRQPLVYGDWSK